MSRRCRRAEQVRTTPRPPDEDGSFGPATEKAAVIRYQRTRSLGADALRWSQDLDTDCSNKA
jgi:hypothetical protein